MLSFFWSYSEENSNKKKFQSYPPFSQNLPIVLFNKGTKKLINKQLWWLVVEWSQYKQKSCDSIMLIMLSGIIYEEDSFTNNASV